MQWIHRFDLFLFDFDGLLVNTEHLHYQAYIDALAKRGIEMPFSLTNFYELAHTSSDAWKKALVAKCPEVDGDWPTFYQEKKEAYIALIGLGKIELMPGVTPLLKALDQAKRERCVVTHSDRAFTQRIAEQLPILRTIPHWITREDYGRPKPDPECYLKAIQMFGKIGDRIIGFEDSIRGLSALKKTGARALLICPKHYPLLEMALESGGEHFESLLRIQNLH